ncbi:WXG100 family type VII secretion target [Herpetosiphon giganteus]|uniref:WXG100 family type VII secretion target n=1 Tax=Herpetosiphon giganteus TaxID=2029754 RepID=UPI001959374B|nr:WXG100 family type VII secretion target [Herpetosiphon giganteus]MBM7845303.1 WXG100 family type VII secretion target [Herpetosiphon giganteus]
MPAPIVLIEYERMRELSHRFQRQAEVVLQLDQQLNQLYQQLLCDWQGDSANHFFNEMQTNVFPALGRLKAVLITAQQVTLNVNGLLREAEIEAASLFNQTFDEINLPTIGMYGNPAAKSTEVRNPEYRKVDKPAFAKGSGDSDAIAFDDVNQGLIADCYLMAGLAAIAKTNPDVIRNAIRDNGDGTYTVTFYPEQGFLGFFGKRSKVEVRVTNDFVYAKDGKTPAYAQLSNDSEIWPMLIEKAYAQHKGSFAAIAYGDPGEFMALLTGKDSSQINGSKVDFTQLKQRLDSGDAITAGTYKSLSNPPSDVDARHAYVIQSIDLNKQTVTMYNPWGYEHPTISFDEFKKHYQQVSINEKD